MQQDNAGVIVNPKGEMKGSAITGPVAKECVRYPLLSCHTEYTHSSLSPGGSLATYRVKCGHCRMSTIIPSTFSSMFVSHMPPNAHPCDVQHA